MESFTRIRLQFLILILTVFLVVFLNQILLAEAQELKREKFNFVAAGDWVAIMKQSILSQ